jgi:hypothetical protein
MIFRRAEKWILSRPHTRAVLLGFCLAVACAGLLAPGSHAEQPAATPATAPAVQQKAFDTPEAAAEALIRASEQFDVPALKEILGPEGMTLVVTGDPVQDKNRCVGFAAQARAQLRVARDPKNSNRATLLIGAEEWPAPVPLVKKSGKWRFDSKAGLQEVLFRRIGENELDAIELCRGYVEAQDEYASQKHDGAEVNQYAQRIISTPGKQDGLAWQAADGTWQGPVGEGIAHIIAEGYTDQYSPYHGYFFKVLKGQGPAAPMGEMDFVVKGMMIGGFALVAAPAEYAVTGVKTFIVSHNGVVYEKDLGPKTLDEFRAMERYNPDSTWSPVASSEVP